MNALLRWLASPEWAHVVAALLHSLWQGAFVALALAVLMRRLTNPLTRYRCALSALGGIGIAGIVTWALLNAPNSALKSTAATTIESIAPALTAAAFDFNPPDKVVVVGQMTRPETPTDWTVWLALAWMAGAMAMLLRAGVKVAGAEKLRRSCQPLTDESIALLVAEACRAVGLARKIRVAVTDKLTSPAVVGVLVPTLILPLTLFTTLTPTQIQFVLLHELAHIRRGDYLANLFQLFAEALLFFNPAVWWISHQIRREREACCDALAIELSGAPADYARTLVRVAENILQPGSTAASAFGDDGREPSTLADRVQRLLIPGYRPALRLTWRAMATSLLVGVTLLVLSAVGTRNTVGAILSSTQLATNASPQLQSTPPTGASEQKRELHRSVSGAGVRMIVDRPTLTQTESNQPLFDTNEPAHEIIASGDFIVVTFAGLVAPPLPHQEPVKPDGSILMPLIGRVVAAGKSVGQLQTEIHDAYVPRYYKNMHVKITVNSPSDLQAFLLEKFGYDLPTHDFRRITNATDRVPFLGDLPLLGKLFTSESSAVRQTWLTGDDSFSTSNWTVVGQNQLNQKWFWNRAGETNPKTAAGRTNSEPLLTRTFCVDVNALYAAARKADGLPETTSLSNLHAGVRTFFAQAGVNLDPQLGRSMFFSDSRGDMWIRATKDELDIIESLLRPLAGIPLSPGNFQITPQTLADARSSLPAAINSILATNPAAGFRALLESFDPTDPRPKLVQYNSESGELLARATEVDLQKFADALNISRVTNSVLARSETTPATNLVTRIFQVEPVAIEQGFRQMGVELAFSTTTNHPSAEMRTFLEEMGVGLAPPKSIYYNHHSGALSVSATQSDLDSVEQVLRVLNIARQAPQVNLKVRPELSTRTFVVGPMELAKALNRKGPLKIIDTAEMVSACLAKAGLDLQPPKSVFFKDPLTLLMVRATPAELDSLENFLFQSQSKMISEYRSNRVAASPTLKRTPAGTNLYTRTFAVDMNALHLAVTQRFGTNAFSKYKPAAAEWLPALRQLFASIGVALRLPESLYLNDQKGELFVRATPADLDTISSFLEVLNYQSPQVNIKVRWLELPPGTEFSSLVPRPANSAAGPAAALEQSSEELTELQTDEILHRLRRDKGFTLVSEGQVTTLSARQAQLRVAEVKTIVTGIRPEALTLPGVVATNTPAAAAFNAEVVPLGPVLDVTPCVNSDQNQIALHIEANTKTFLGYVKKSPKVSVYINGIKNKTTLPLPRYLVQQLTNDCVLRDGHTLVLGHLSTTELATQPDGSIQRTDLNAARTNNLWILVTATLIDPAGNRLNPPK